MGSYDHFRPTHSISKTTETNASQNPKPELWTRGNMVLRRTLNIVYTPEPISKMGFTNFHCGSEVTTEQLRVAREEFLAADIPPRDAPLRLIRQFREE